MEFTRRKFLKITAAAGGALVAWPVISHHLAGKVSFDGWRALAGMRMGMTLDVREPERTEVELVARTPDGSVSIGKMRGAARLSFEVPFVETDGRDSFEIYAFVRDEEGRTCVGEPLEVLTEQFTFGM